MRIYQCVCDRCKKRFGCSAAVKKSVGNIITLPPVLLLATLFLILTTFEREVMIQPYLDSVGGGFFFLSFVPSEIRKKKRKKEERPV